jgi:hypothetical protein
MIPTMDFAADIPLLYADLGDLVTAPFGTFNAVLSPADQEAWDTARVGTHTLRYPTTAALTTGMLLTIAGASYKVAAIPLRLNGNERIADLIIQ